ncbi:NLP3-like protein, partial [Tanacetum coccineum]
STLKLRWLMKPHKQMLLSSVRFPGMISDVDCSTMVVKLGYTDPQSDSTLKPNQTDLVIHASDRTATSVLETSIEQSGPTNIYVPASLTEHGNQSSTLVRHNEEQKNLPDGLVKLEELVATRFKLSPRCLRLKYADADGDMILIACDNDLMGSAGDSR